ncbi:MAG: DNA primase [Terrimicrobiaceae bacterium]
MDPQGIFRAVGFISEESIQRVADANDIVDVVGSYFPLKRAGTSFRALCPFHREKSPSFHVNPARQSYHCFGCGAGGGVLRFVMDYEHLDFPTAVRRLAQRANIPIVEEASTPDDERKHGLRKRLLALHAEAAHWFHHNLLKSPDGAAARDYLKSRGLNSEIAKSWKLGYAPESWDALLNHLRDRKFSREEIEQSGLASSKDDRPGAQLYSRFRNRVMFPIHNDYGEVVAFSGRTLEADPKAAKYVNSPETPLFTKGRVLYGLDKTKRDLIEKNAAIVCEGQIDLISAFEAGVRHVIAPQGTAFTTDQARLLKRYVETVLLCFDSDAAGKKAADRSVPALLSQGLTVKIIALPSGEDPDSLIRKQGPAAFLKLVETAREYFDHNLAEAVASGELEDTAGKSRLVRRLAPALALVQDAVLRDALLGRISTRLGVSPTSIRAVMKAPAIERDTPDSTPQTPPEEVISLSAGMKMLGQLLLSSADVREWLRSQTPLADFEPHAALLDKITRADFPDQLPPPASLMAHLTGPEERFLSSLETLRAVPDPLDRAKSTIQGLRVRQFELRIEELKSRVGDSSLPLEERQKIQKQILDLKIRLADLRRPFDLG